MRIRHKRNHADMQECVEESPSFYISERNGFGNGWPKTHWEPVPQSTWRDVTAECEVEDDSCIIRHKGEAIDVMNGYRVTRISGPLQPHVAFIVEKQE